MVADRGKLGGVELGAVEIVTAEVDVVVLEVAFDMGSCGLCWVSLGYCKLDSTMLT